jgi:hypothetical protein
MKKIGQFFNEVNKLKNEVMQLRSDVYEITKEARLAADVFSSKEKTNAHDKNKKTPKKINPRSSG